MMICRIEGAVHSSIQNRTLDGERLLLAQPLTLLGAPLGPLVVALDRADAGPGDRVLVMKEGGGARLILGEEQSPVQAIVIAVIDDLRIDAT